MANESDDPHARSHFYNSQLLEMKWLALTYNSVGDCLFLLLVEPDGGFQFVCVNEAFLKVTGMTADQIVGKRIEEVIPQQAHSLVLSKYREALSENRTVSWEEVTVYPTGKRVGEVKVTPLRD